MIHLLFTGGTIAMRHQPLQGGNVPALDGAAVLEAIGGLGANATVRTEDWERLPAVHRTPAGMWALRDRVATLTTDPAIQGIVIAHGTDTLAEMAYLLRRTIAPACPIVLTGAMRTSSVVGWDGPRNLRDAVRVAAALESRGRGTMVVFAGRILDGAETIKEDTAALEAFGTPHGEALGSVVRGVVRFRRASPESGVLPARDLSPRVVLWPAALGDDGEALDRLRDGAEGLVVAGYGRGNLPPAMLPALERWLHAGKPVVLASQCPRGVVAPEYAFAGGGATVLALGVVPAGARTAAQARLELILALSAGTPYGWPGASP